MLSYRKIKPLKIVMPSVCDTYTNSGKIRKSNGFCKIELDDCRLSITGVIGPRSNGDCYGSAGQCTDAIREGDPADGWDREMLDRFCDIWERWHLNDMRPECEHQRKLGWRDLSVKKVYKFSFRLNKEANDKKRKSEKAALEALRKGETFTPSEDQIKFATLPDFAEVYSYEEQIEAPEFYEPRTFSFNPNYRETKTLGWVYPDQFEDGILAKPCPVCGYKYGTKWLHEEIPEDIVEFLKSLPDAPVTPAWC